MRSKSLSRAKAMLFVVLAVAVNICTAPDAAAQNTAPTTAQLSGGVGWTELWDDETQLGRGTMVTLGAGMLLSRRLLVEGSFDAASHIRDSGYLRVEGTTQAVFARATYLFGADDARIRPTAGASLGVLHGSGALIARSVVFDGSVPVQGPDERRPWSITRPAFDVHGGARVQLTNRVALRPEARWRATWGTAASAAIEPPLINLQAMLHIDVGLR